MAKNYVEAIINKNYKQFNDTVQESLNESRDETFRAYSETFLTEDAHDEMVSQHLDNMDVVDSPELFDDEVSEEEIAAHTDAEIEELLADLDLEEQIEMLLDAEAITEEELDTISLEQIDELSRKTLQNYSQKVDGRQLQGVKRGEHTDRGDGSALPDRGAKREGNRDHSLKIARQKLVGGKHVKVVAKEEAQFDAKAFAESIVSQYVKKKASDSTGTAVINGDNNAPKEEPEASKKATATREKKQPGKVEGSEKDPFGV